MSSQISIMIKNTKMKISIILFFLILILSLTYAENIPLFINSEEAIYTKLSKDINSKLPKKVDILIFDLSLLNADDNLNQLLNKNFKMIMKNRQKRYNYFISFFSDIDNKEDGSLSFINNYNEQELLAYADHIGKDAIFIASVTIINKKSKVLWDKKESRFLLKNIALLQGNILSVETKESMLRFTYYFYFD